MPAAAEGHSAEPSSRCWCGTVTEAREQCWCCGQPLCPVCHSLLTSNAISMLLCPLCTDMVTTMIEAIRERFGLHTLRQGHHSTMAEQEVAS